MQEQLYELSEIFLQSYKDRAPIYIMHLQSQASTKVAKTHFPKM